MSKAYGMTIGCQDAIAWVSAIPTQDIETKERVLNRMRYEFDKSKPVEPKFRKGLYGRQYDSYACGNCGFTIRTEYKWCPNCGFRITDNYLGRRKTREEQGDHF